MGISGEARGVGDLVVKGAREVEGYGVVVEGGAAGGGAGVAEERRQHRRAPHEDHRPAQGQRACPPIPLSPFLLLLLAVLLLC